MSTRLFRLLIVFLIILPIGQVKNTQAQPQLVQYLFPLPGSKYNSTQTTIAVRFGDTINMSSINNKLFLVSGTTSGNHSGEVVLADDQKTIIFKPKQPFNTGETVDVNVRQELCRHKGNILPSVSFTFSISSTRSVIPKVLSLI